MPHTTVPLLHHYCITTVPLPHHSQAVAAGLGLSGTGGGVAGSQGQGQRGPLARGPNTSGGGAPPSASAAGAAAAMAAASSRYLSDFQVGDCVLESTRKT